MIRVGEMLSGKARTPSPVTRSTTQNDPPLTGRSLVHLRPDEPSRVELLQVPALAAAGRGRADDLAVAMRGARRRW